MATWFVTGGSGFVGRNLIRRLISDGHTVRALARSPTSAATVADLGATALNAEIDDTAALTRHMSGCDFVIHAAAKLGEWGELSDYERVNVEGTRCVLEAARTARVPRLIHVGTEAPFATGTAVLDLDETRPLPTRPLPRYPASKAAAERLVRDATGPDLETVVVRPRLIWGNDDSSLLPQLVAAVRSGRFMWLDGGKHLTSTCHVDNVCEGIVCAALRGKPGAAYFLTDGSAIGYRAFLGPLLQQAGVEIPTASMPTPIAWGAAVICETLWRFAGLGGTPPVTRVAVALMGYPITVSDALARDEIGYSSPVSRQRMLPAVS